MNRLFHKNFPISYHTLSNGLKVCIVENHTSPIVSINLAYKVGSKNEIPGKTGLAHLFEHLMFEGSANVPKGEFDRLCSLAGGNNNAYTNYDVTSYTMTLPSNQLELAFWLESDRMGEFCISADSLKTQQKVVVEEIHQTVEDQPYGTWRESLASAAFSSDYSYSWEIHGSRKDVKNAKMKDIEKFFQMFYQPDNACLVVGGDVIPEQTLELADKYFGAIKSNRSEDHTIEFKDSFRKKGEHRTITQNVPLDALFLCFHAPGFKNTDVLAGDILANIAAGSKSSRFYSPMVYQGKLASQVGAFIDKRETASLIIFYAFAMDEKISSEMLYDQLKKEIQLLQSSGIKKREYNKTINQLNTQIASEFQYLYNITDNLGEQVLFWDNPERIYTTLEKFTSISIEDVDNFSNNYIKFEEEIRIDAKMKK